MTERQDEQRERRATVLNDARVREQQRGATFSQFAESEATEPRGRFTAHEKSTVIGSTPVPSYPQGPAWSTADQALEPSLGVDINQMQPCGEPHEVRASIAAQAPLEPSLPEAQGNSGDPADAPSPKPPPGLMSKRAGSPPFSKSKR